MTKNKIVVTSYKDLDMDGYSSAVAYAELLGNNGSNATAVVVGRISKETEFVLDFLNIVSVKSINDFVGYDSIILVDADSLESTELEADPRKVIEIIDHHVETRPLDFCNAKIQRELIGACATLITERFLVAGLVPKRETAVMLYAGITSNTINLKNKITSERDIKAASYLKRIGQIDDNFVQKMFDHKSDLTDKKLEEALKNDYYVKELFGHTFSMSQLEITDAKKLIETRENEIKQIISTLTVKDVEYQFLNIIDILEGHNFIFAFNEKTKLLLTEVLNISFSSDIAEINHIVMRKEIIAKVKDYLQNE